MNRILIVEDEEFLVMALKDNLEGEGYVVDVAQNGEEALLRINKERPSLILLDLLMPKRDGYYVLEKVKQDPKLKDIPVIVLSNFGNDTEIKRAIQMGADDYFVKSQHMIVEVLVKVVHYLEEKKDSNDLIKKITAI